MKHAWGAKRALVVFMLAFVVTTAELCWWVTFNLQETAKLNHKQAQLQARDCALAQELLAGRREPEAWLAEHFPDVLFDAATGRVSPRPAVVELREAQGRAHLRMFVAEGAFFFFMVLLGAAIIMRTIRREVGVVRQQANFLNAVTHELKSPLATMRLYIETLERRRVDPTTLARYVATLRAECDRLEVLVSHVLTLARLERPRAPQAAPSPSGPLPQDLHGAIAAAVRQLSHGRGALSPPIVVEEPDHGPIAVAMAEASLHTVLRNLLDNACKYGATGERITVRTGVDNGRAWLAISDSGIGLAAEEHGRVFERFYRVGDEMVRRHEGSGLGLYLVRLLLAEEGGTIEVHSAGLGEGATFTVRLPLSTRREAPPAALGDTT